MACGLTEDGAAYCWGNGSLGQLGTGTSSNSAAPLAVAGSLRFAKLDVGFYEACGLTFDGVAYCWGLNDRGQLGTTTTGRCGTSACSTQPVRVETSLRFTALDVGERYACALTDEGRAYCWGANDTGQLGDGSTTDRARPTAVASLRTYASVAAGYGLRVMHTCAATSAGEALWWGYNGAGALGTGTSTSSLVPAPVAGGLSFRALTAAGGQVNNTGSLPHTCGLTTAGAVYCWGDNRNGELGIGTTAASAVPARVRYP
jgi:alpha-tubulin suppressor-like RCC1 family protein